MSVIIVEGIDRIGKTVFCERLSQASTYPVFKQMSLYVTPGVDEYTDDTGYHPGCEAMYEQLNALTRLLHTLNCPDVIIDRFHMTEKVYGFIDRYTSSDAAYEMIDTLLAELQDVCLVLMRSANIERSSFEHGSDLSEHADMFDRVFDESVIQKKLIINGYENIDDGVEKTIKLMHITRS